MSEQTSHSLLPILTPGFEDISWINAQDLAIGPWSFRVRSPFSEAGAQVNVLSRSFPHLGARYLWIPWSTQADELGQLELNANNIPVVWVTTSKEGEQLSTSIHTYAISADKEEGTTSHVVYVDGEKRVYPLVIGCLPSMVRNEAQSDAEEKEIMKLFGIPMEPNLPDTIDSDAVLRTITDIALNGYPEDLTKIKGSFGSLLQAGS